MSDLKQSDENEDRWRSTSSCSDVKDMSEDISDYGELSSNKRKFMASVKINDTSKFDSNPAEAPRVDKDYVFEEGELFIPMVNAYEDRIVYSPYVVHKRFSIEEMVNKFKDHLEPGSYLVEENTNKLLDLMKDHGYISLQVSIKTYNFGDYYFLGTKRE